MTTRTLEPEQALHSALSHELRVKLLREMAKGERSPGDMAAVVEAPLGVVSYHVRMLRDYGAVTLSRTEPRRGALQHYYVLTDLGRHAVAVSQATTRRLG